MFIDYWYIVLVLPALLFSLIAQAKVKHAYSAYSAVRTYRGMTGREVAEHILHANGVYDVRVQPIAGTMTDNFNPRNRTVNLSRGVYDSCSVAAVGIAAHEAGHACQYAENYKPIQFRNRLVPVVRIGSQLAMPLIVLGMLFYGAAFSSFFVMLGVLLFGLSTVFQLATLPVEFNASARAVKALEHSFFLTEEELNGTKKVLKAAAMTYVAALAVSFASFLRIILLTQRRGRR